MQAVEQEIDHRRRIERQDLGDRKPADDGHAERPAQLGAGPGRDQERDRAQQRRHGGHQDRAEPVEAGLVDRLIRGQAAALALDGEIDQHDAVLLDDADQQDDADEGDDRQLGAEGREREQRAEARRGQGRDDGERVGEALIEHAQHDIDPDQGREDQDFLRRRALGEHPHVAGEFGAQRVRQVHLGDRLQHRVGGGLQRRVRGEIVGDGHRGILALVIDRQRRVGFRQPRHRRQRHLGPAGRRRRRRDRCRRGRADAADRSPG